MSEKCVIRPIEQNVLSERTNNLKFCKGGI